jgi:hypothetical protein
MIVLLYWYALIDMQVIFDLFNAAKAKVLSY